jgi:hypothetical protein
MLQLYPVLPACKNKGCFLALWATNVSHNGSPVGLARTR